MSDSPSRPGPGSRSSGSPGPDPGGVALSVEGDVAHLTLCRERARNALSPAMLDELDAALGEIERMRGVKLLVVRGEGRVFSVGADLAAVEVLSPIEVEAFFRRGRSVVDRLHDLEILTVAAVNGLALGGGFELALACDLRWAHGSAAFGFPEVRLGLIPGWRGIRLLSRLRPSSEVIELLACGNNLGARAAHRLGLVSRVFEGRTFLDQVRSGLDELSARKPGPLRAIKALVRARSDEMFAAAEAVTLQALWAERRSGTNGPEGG